MNNTERNTALIIKQSPALATSPVYQVTVVCCHGLGLVVHHILLHLHSAQAGQLINTGVARHEECNVGADVPSSGEHVEPIHAAPHALKIVNLLVQVLRENNFLIVNKYK